MAVLYHADARKRTGPAYVYFIPPVQSVRPLHLQKSGKACPLEDIIDLLRHMDHADRALHRLTEQKDDPEAGTRDIIQILGIQDNRPGLCFLFNDPLQFLLHIVRVERINAVAEPDHKYSLSVHSFHDIDYLPPDISNSAFTIRIFIFPTSVFNQHMRTIFPDHSDVAVKNIP